MIWNIIFIFYIYNKINDIGVFKLLFKLIKLIYLHLNFEINISSNNKIK